MIDFHGWITLSDDPYESEMSEIVVAQAELEGWAAAARTRATRIEFHNIGGSPFVSLDGEANHRRAEHDAVDVFLKKVGERLPGSFGIVYWRDDESPTGNSYRVLVMARGQVTVRDDPFLSPCNPVIED